MRQGIKFIHFCKKINGSLEMDYEQFSTLIFIVLGLIAFVGWFVMLKLIYDIL